MAGAAAVAAAVAQAVKASGAIVRVEPRVFLEVLDRHEAPVVVRASGGFIWNRHYYLTSYKGLEFYTQASEALSLPGHCEIFEAKSIWIPG